MEFEIDTDATQKVSHKSEIAESDKERYHESQLNTDFKLQTQIGINNQNVSSHGNEFGKTFQETSLKDKDFLISSSNSNDFERLPTRMVSFRKRIIQK